jgi:hypothetical protein
VKVGTFAYPTSRGLGHLAKDFADHGITTDTLVVEHASIPSNADWYPSAPRTNARRLDRNLMFDFCRGKDAMLFFETPFLWDVIPHCAAIGVRTYLLVMHECTPAVHSPPHRYLCPSSLDMHYFKDHDAVFLQLPVDPQKVPWRQREKAELYVHHGGYLGLRGREGTALLIDAMRYVKSPLKLQIRVQENVDATRQRQMAQDARIEYLPQTIPFAELWQDGDVYVAPQKFNGCSLPLQEAYASGMLVMTTDRFPMNTWLPREPMIPTKGILKDVQVGGPYLPFDESVIDPEDIARTMDAWHERDIAEWSRRGRAWAEANSWEQLKPLWMEQLSK